MYLGKNGSLVDNAHAGGCFIGIDVNTGKLQDKVFYQFGEHFLYGFSRLQGILLLEILLMR